MGLEIDFLPVGDESSGGDAIALRYGNLYGGRSEQTVIVIDGGYQDSGEKMVEHLDQHYGTDHVDVVVSTHPDQDHMSGLAVVLERCKVGELWMHRPWTHSGVLMSLSAQGFRFDQSQEQVRSVLRAAQQLERLAENQGTKVVEPFTGLPTHDGAFRIMRPNVDYYRSLLPDAFSTRQRDALRNAIYRRFEQADQTVLAETLEQETLNGFGETSPRNNTSVIALLQVDGRRALFTADAGVPALSHGVRALRSLGIGPGELDFVQVPHHGSRRNVSPHLLDCLLGPVTDQVRGTAYVSAPTKNPEQKHPAKQVTNAFRRRGYPVHSTCGSTKRYHHNAPSRPGFSPSDALPLYSRVEAKGAIA